MTCCPAAQAPPTLAASGPSSVSNSEVKLHVASLLSDRILDEILASLSRSQHTLVSPRPAVQTSPCPSVCLHLSLTPSPG